MLQRYAIRFHVRFVSLREGILVLGECTFLRSEWIILVLVIGGRDHKTPQKAIYLVYKWYILPIG